MVPLLFKIYNNRWSSVEYPLPVVIATGSNRGFVHAVAVLIGHKLIYATKERLHRPSCQYIILPLYLLLP